MKRLREFWQELPSPLRGWLLFLAGVTSGWTWLPWIFRSLGGS